MSRGALISALAPTLAALALALPPAALATTQRTSLVAVEQEVMCVTCGIPLAEADSPAAQQEKTFIQGLVAAGDTTAQIKARLVSEYGVAVLALPPDSGFNVAFYLIPIAAVAAAVGIVVLLLPRWRRNRRSTPAAPGAPALSELERARLDADLARFDG